MFICFNICKSQYYFRPWKASIKTPIISQITSLIENILPPGHKKTGFSENILPPGHKITSFSENILPPGHKKNGLSENTFYLPVTKNRF